MFETLEFQNLKELPKCQVRDFSPPKPFHTLKVECLGGNKVKPPTEVSGTFVVPISALVRNLTIQPCQLSDGTPPVARTLLLLTDGPGECLKLVQGFLQKLWRLNLLTGAECQIGVHSEVYPYTFTCSGHDFFGGYYLSQYRGRMFRQYPDPFGYSGQAPANHDGGDTRYSCGQSRTSVSLHPSL